MKMKDKQMVSDELLAKYLSGATTLEETEQVLSFLAESEEHFEEFASICEAIVFQKEAEKKAAQRARRRLWMRISYATTAAAAVAAIILILTPLHIGRNGNEPPVIAQTAPVKLIKDTVANATEVGIAGSDIATAIAPTSAQVRHKKVVGELEMVADNQNTLDQHTFSDSPDSKNYRESIDVNTNQNSNFATCLTSDSKNHLIDVNTNQNPNFVTNLIIPKNSGELIDKTNDSKLFQNLLHQRQPDKS